MNTSHKNILILAAALLLNLGSVQAYCQPTKKPVLIQTHIQPPYQVMTQTGISGDTPKILDCIFQTLERPFELKVAPRKRNKLLLESHQADGVLLNTLNPELDKIAVATDPMAIEKWKFFKRKDLAASKGDNRILTGAIMGSNEAHWLVSNNIQSSDSIPHIKALVKLTNVGRINNALADERAFHRAVHKLNIPLEKFESKFVKYVPLVAYFSKDFLKQNPQFMQGFNSALNQCIDHELTLNNEEKNYLLNLAKQTTHPSHEEFYNLLMQVNFKLKERKNSHDEDIKWQKAVLEKTSSDLMKTILNNDLSLFLKKLQVNTPFISEIFVTDTDGFIRAMSQPTSDYWQGDEQPYKNVMNFLKDYYLSTIHFDHSSRRFQIQVALPLKAPNDDKRQGMIVIGFDAEKALLKKNNSLFNPIANSQ